MQSLANSKQHLKKWCKCECYEVHVVISSALTTLRNIMDVIMFNPKKNVPTETVQK